MAMLTTQQNNFQSQFDALAAQHSAERSAQQAAFDQQIVQMRAMYGAMHPIGKDISAAALG